MSIKTAIVSGAKKLMRGAKANAPTIMVIFGSSGLVGAGVLACVKTAKELDPVLKEHKENVQALKDIRDGVVVLEEYTTEEYAETKYKKHLTAVYLRTIAKLAKVYGPAFLLAVLSLVSILTGHKILTKRHLAAVAECAAGKELLNEYRKKVAGKIGEEAEKNLFYDGETALITDEEVDESTGEVKTESHEGFVGKHKNMQYTYICSPDTMCSYVRFNSDANFRNMVDMRLREINQYFEVHDQAVLGDVMRHFWNDKYLRQHPEIFTDGWWVDNPLGPKLDDYRPINAVVKLISEPGQPRKYAVTFNAQGNIAYAMKAAKDKERKAKKISRKIAAAVK